MRLTALALVLLAAVPASAQPITQPSACAVTIARAPDEVRAVVEAWVRAEPRCSTVLEVRVVPTDGGLYLLATDERGGIRERIVPDAQSAGVLVASWIADDSTQPLPTIDQTPAPVVTSPATTEESLAPPGLAPITIAKRAPLRRSRWVTIGSMTPLSPSPTVGLRGEIDVWAVRGGLSIGFGASYGISEIALVGSGVTGGMQTHDTKGLAYVAHTSQLGRWQLRPGLGAGLMYTDAAFTLTTSSSSFIEYYQIDGMSPVVEVSTLLTRELGKRWAVFGGPLVSLVSQEFQFQMAGATYPTTVMRSAVDFVLFAGGRYRL